MEHDLATASGPARRSGGGWARPGILVAVGIGGMVGATTRYAIGRAVPDAEGGLPWATLGVNLAGSFLLGLLLVAALERLPPRSPVRPFVATGVLGSLTTMSAFQVETARLLSGGRYVVAATYATVTVVVGLTLAVAGARTGRVLSVASTPDRP